MVLSPASNEAWRRAIHCPGVSLSWERHPLRELWRPGPSAVCCISSLASCHGISDRTGTVCWRSGCADWHSVSTGSGVYCRCDAWSYLSGAPTQWVRYRQGRRGICTHTVVTGSSVPLNRPGLVLTGVLASGIATEILSPGFDSDHLRIVRTPH